MKSFLIFVLLLLVGCAASFEVAVEQGDKFSDPNSPIQIRGRNNRISSKTTPGGIDITGGGLFLDPFVMVDKASNKPWKTGFSLFCNSAAIKSGFNPISEVILLADKNRFQMVVSMYDHKFDLGSWNSLTKEYNSTYHEFCTCECSLEDLKKIASAKMVEVKIIGNNASQTYEGGEVFLEWLDNMREFVKKVDEVCKT